MKRLKSLKSNPRGCYSFRVHARLSSQLPYRIYWGGVPRRACAPRPAGGLTPCAHSLLPSFTNPRGCFTTKQTTARSRQSKHAADTKQRTAKIIAKHIRNPCLWLCWSLLLKGERQTVLQTLCYSFAVSAAGGLPVGPSIKVHSK